MNRPRGILSRVAVVFRTASAAAALALVPMSLAAQVVTDSASLSTSMLAPVDTDTARVGRFDRGRMWTFEVPPAEYFRETYDIPADSAWFEQARLGALRIPGCSAAFVSPSGLVMTNHHCVRDYVSQVSAPGEDLLENGFFAQTRDEEREVKGFTADQLLAVRDVTDEVVDEVGDRTGARRAERLAEVEADIVERLTEEFGREADSVHVELIELYHGARHSAYVFRRWENATLVMAPSVDIGFFGGDADNFTYPRYNLDVAFMRVREADGAPAEVESWFPLSQNGVTAGDPVFVVGNPGSTSRLHTMAELEFRREVADRGLLDFAVRRMEALEEYVEAFPAEAGARGIHNDLFGAQNLIKATRGQLEGLSDPVILARLQRAERELREAIQSDPTLAEEYGGLIEQLGSIQREKEELAQGYRAFLGLTADGFESPTLHRSFLVWQILNLRGQGAPISYTADLQARVDSVGDVPAELDQLLIEARLRDLIDQYGQDARWIQSILRGRTPEGAAAVIHQQSMFSDSARTAEGVRRGGIDPNDPALRFVDLYLPSFRAFQEAVAGLTSREEELAARLGRARYAIHGPDVPPDATGSLRIADGVVRGYPYNGTTAPHVTTLFGMYDRHHSFEGEYQDPEMSPWALPERWLPVPEGLDLSTPLNFVSTADISGGNSGSPVLNAELEVVGLAFDSSIESLPGDYIFLPEIHRSVIVDVRAVLHALDVVWEMDDLVSELRTARPGITVRGTTGG